MNIWVREEGNSRAYKCSSPELRKTFSELHLIIKKNKQCSFLVTLIFNNFTLAKLQAMYISRKSTFKIKEIHISADTKHIICSPSKKIDISSSHWDFSRNRKEKNEIICSVTEVGANQETNFLNFESRVPQDASLHAAARSGAQTPRRRSSSKPRPFCFLRTYELFATKQNKKKRGYGQGGGKDRAGGTNCTDTNSKQGLSAQFALEE